MYGHPRAFRRPLAGAPLATLTVALLGVVALSLGACGESADVDSDANGGGATSTGARSFGGGNTGATAAGGAGTGAAPVGGMVTGGATNGGAATGGAGPVRSDVRIDDAEDGDLTISPFEDRSGAWYTADDGTSTITLESVAGGADGSSRAIKFSGVGSGVNDGWGALAGFTFAGTEPEQQPYDASSFDGIAFTVRTDGPEDLWFSVKVVDVNTWKDGGVCIDEEKSPGSGNCNDHYFKTVKVTGDWTRVELPWAELQQQGYGLQTDALDPSALVAVEFTVRGEFSYLVDDVEFLSSGGDGTGGTSGSGGANSSGGAGGGSPCGAQACGVDADGNRCGYCGVGEVCSAGSCTTNVGTPVATHGALSVSGNRIKDSGGNNVQLRGLSSMWLNYEADRYAQNLEGTRWLRDNWNLELTRAAMGVNRDDSNADYFSNKEFATEQVETMVQNALDLGIYVIIDWHSHTADQEQAEAVAFFSEMAEKYGAYPNVIYEPFNEPINQSWSTIKAYHQAVVNAIRAKDPDNLIVLGNRQWDQYPNEAADDPVAGTNLAYTVHFYSCEHGSWLRDRADYALEQGVALFVTEWGAATADGVSGCGDSEATAWTNWMNTNSISWAAWKWDGCNEHTCWLKAGSPVTGGWTDASLNGHGTFVRSKLLE